MSNTLGINYAADHAEQERDRGLYISYSNNLYPAIVSIPQNMREYESDGSGYFKSLSMIASVQIDKIGTEIAVGDTITYDGTDYRISDIQSDTELGIHIMTCEGLAL